MSGALFLVTQPVELAKGLLLIAIANLGAWWIILRLSETRPKTLMRFSVASLAIGILLSALPTLMLTTGIVWPSLVVILQFGAIGGGILGTVSFCSVALAVWRLIACVVDGF